MAKKLYIYICDFLIATICSLCGFLANMQLMVVPFYWCVVISLSAGFACLISFSIFKIYKIIPIGFELRDLLKICFPVILVRCVELPFVYVFCYKTFYFGYFMFVVFEIGTSILFHGLVRILPTFLSTLNNGKHKIVRTLVIGAGESGKIFIDECFRNCNNHNLVVAIIDDSTDKIGKLLCGIPVRGPISNVKSIIDKEKIEEVVIAMSLVSQKRLHEIYELLEPCSVRIRRLPLLNEMIGPNNKNIIDIDFKDLLCRDQIQLDNQSIFSTLNNTCVLVTGAGGSIGSELVRQIFNLKPNILILFDIYENSTYDIQMELKKSIRSNDLHGIEIITLIGSTYNERRVEEIFKRYKPDYVFHAAAYKHVPLMEDSPAEAIRTNVLGTYFVAKMADKYQAKTMVLVSTDKAVRPTNVMGATKKFAENIIQFYSSKSQNTKYVAVRFGNVLGSNGSVVPLFKKQIESGGPITITDKRIIRYFMTIPEAVSLIMQCCVFAKGGEIFILDMGKPVKILHLAEKMIRQAGLVPYKDIDIVETGLRPGEKLYEELLIDSSQEKTSNSRIFIETKASINEDLYADIEEAVKAFDMENVNDVKSLIQRLITSYTPSMKA